MRRLNFIGAIAWKNGLFSVSPKDAKKKNQADNKRVGGERLCDGKRDGVLRGGKRREGKVFGKKPGCDSAQPALAEL